MLEEKINQQTNKAEKELYKAGKTQNIQPRHKATKEEKKDSWKKTQNKYIQTTKLGDEVVINHQLKANEQGSSESRELHSLSRGK